MPLRPEDLQATFAATLVDEWARRGVRHAVVAPGSRSTPMAMALADHGGIALHVHHDERSASFLALGIGLATGAPAVLLTTSGTAAAQLHAAVIEADQAQVPLLVCTADRPPELQGIGAPQTIDQVHLYGGSVRGFHAPGVAEATSAPGWRDLAARTLAEALGLPPGPVHLNLAFREPLLGTPAALPARGPEPDHPGPAGPDQGPDGELVVPVDALVGRRGLFLAGPASEAGPPLDALARRLGWPVLAAPQAPVWSVPDAVVHVPDALLRCEPVRDGLRPEVVVRLGTPLASKVVGEWVAASGAHEIVAAGHGRRVDPYLSADVVMPVRPGAAVAAWSADLDQVEPTDAGRWRARWTDAGCEGRAAIDALLDSDPLPSEPSVARDLAAALPDGSELVVSSSMPVRDLEWYARPRSGVRVHANRGANGIDGVVSTAAGVALGSGRPTALLIGDVALLHDANGLLGLGRRSVDLVVVAIDNDGGGIFSFLPQAAALDRTRFESLFGTPHGVDLVALATAHGVSARQVTGAVGDEVREAIGAGGTHVLVVRTDREANVAVHTRLHDAVRDAMDHRP